MSKALGAASMAVAVLFCISPAYAQTGASDGGDHYIRGLVIATGVGIVIFVIAYIIGHSPDRKE